MMPVPVHTPVKQVEVEEPVSEAITFELRPNSLLSERGADSLPPYGINGTPYQHLPLLTGVH